MDAHASSSPSHPKTPTDATSTKKEVSSASAEQTSNTWIKDMEGGILKACVNWKRAEFCTSVFPNNIARYDANEGTEKDLTHALGLIYKKYGPLKLRYKGCDGLARNWVAGYNKDSKGKHVRKVMLCVEMKERLPGQSPVLDRLQSKSDSESESDERVREETKEEMKETMKEELKKEVNEEMNEELNDEMIEALIEGLNEEMIEKMDKEMEEEMNDEANEKADEEELEEKDQDRVDWVDVSGGGVDEGDWIRPNDIQSMIKDAGQFLLDGFRKL